MPDLPAPAPRSWHARVLLAQTLARAPFSDFAADYLIDFAIENTLKTALDFCQQYQVRVHGRVPTLAP
jgi:hypothetical protein